MSEANKQVVRRWQEAYNSGDLDELDKVLAPNWASNAWPDGVPQTVEAAKEGGRGMLALFPDYHCRIDELVAEGDRVMMRWTASGTHNADVFGLAPTGRPLEWAGISLFAVKDGRITGHWAFGEELTLLEDMGAQIPPEWALFKHHRAQHRALSDAERIELQKTVLAEHLRGEVEGDWAAVHATFVQDERARYDLVPLSTTFSGIDGVRDVYATLDAALTDWEVTMSNEIHAPGLCMAEGTLSATHRGEYLDIPASGRRITFELAAVVTFGDGDEAGKILCERVYFDHDTVLRQMRGEPDAPTGVGLAQGLATRPDRATPAEPGASSTAGGRHSG